MIVSLICNLTVGENNETINRKVACVLSFLVLEKSAGAFNYSLISIARTISRIYVREKARILFLNRIAKNEL